MLNWLTGKKEKKKTASASPAKPAVADKPFKVSLVAGSGRLVDGTIVEMMMTGIKASFDLERCPELSPEDETKLEFFKFETERTFVVRAIVKEAEKTAEKRIYRFLFPQPDVFISELNKKDISSLNKRESLRMDHKSFGRIEVDLNWGEGEARGWIIDISVTGMGLGVTPETAEAMGKPENLNLSFELPGSDFKFKVLGKVLYHKQAVDKENKHCGVLFDQNKPGGFLAEDNVISTFLVNQQKEQLRMRVTVD